MNSTLNRNDFHRVNGMVMRRDKLPRPTYSDLQRFINHLSSGRQYNPAEDPKAIELRRFRDFLERRNEFTDIKAATDLNKWISQLKAGKITDPEQQKVFIETLIKSGEKSEAVALLTAMMKTGQLNKAIEGETPIDYKKLSEELKNLLIAGFDSLRIDSSVSEDKAAAKSVISMNNKIKEVLKDRFPDIDRTPLDSAFYKLGDAKMIIDRLKRDGADAMRILNSYKLENYPKTFGIVLDEAGEENARNAIKQELTTEYGFRNVDKVDTMGKDQLNKLIEVLNNSMFSFKGDNIANVIDIYNE